MLRVASAAVVAMAFTNLVAIAQSRTEFDVASIRRNGAAAGMIGGTCQGSDKNSNSAGPIATLAAAAGMTPAAPGRCRFTRVTLKDLIVYAYDVPASAADRLLVGGPSWMNADRFDIEAKADGVPHETEMRRMLQTMLADRFKLKVRRETRDTRGYSLEVARGGAKLKASAGGTPSMQQLGGGPLVARAATTARLADLLARRLGQPVIDSTGLTGSYDFALSWTPDDNERRSFGVNPANLPPEIREKLAASRDSSGTSLFTALTEQLGLRLEGKPVPQEILLVDAAERPSEN